MAPCIINDVAEFETGAPGVIQHPMLEGRHLRNDEEFKDKHEMTFKGLLHTMKRGLARTAMMTKEPGHTMVTIRVVMTTHRGRAR